MYDITHQFFKTSKVKKATKVHVQHHFEGSSEIIDIPIHSSEHS